MAIRYGMGWQRDLPDFRDYSPETDKIKEMLKGSRALKNARRKSKSVDHSEEIARLIDSEVKRFLSEARDFYVLAFVVGLVQGGIQSLSRSYYGRLVPQGKSSEFFGFYNMMGKASAIIGPALEGIVAALTGDSRLSILSIVLLFIAGGTLLVVAGRSERRAAVASA